MQRQKMRIAAMTVRQVLVALICLACGGWTSKLSSVDAATPSASVTFNRGYAPSLRPSYTQTYLVDENERCEVFQVGRLKTAAVFTSLDKSSHSYRLPAGKLVKISARITSAKSTGVGYAEGGFTLTVENDACAAQAAFTPEAGHDYTVVQRWSGQACPIEVIDLSTGVAPVDPNADEDAEAISPFAPNAPPKRPCKSSG